MSNSTSQSNANETPNEPDTAAHEAKNAELFKDYEWMVRHSVNPISIGLIEIGWNCRYDHAAAIRANTKNAKVGEGVSSNISFTARTRIVISGAKIITIARNGLGLKTRMPHLS